MGAIAGGGAALALQQSIGGPQVTNENDTTLVHSRSVRVGALDIFYREAGDPSAPTLLLLHGFPTSSHMFRDLIPLLAKDFHLVAPDYPGFGYSATPSVTEFVYTFDHLADVMEGFVDAIGLRSYAIYMQDFGGPVGLRLASRRPKAITGLVVQNANAYREGITPTLDAIVLRAWRDPGPAADEGLRPLFEMPVTRRQFVEGAHDPSLVSPDSYEHAQWGMDRPGNKEIQLAIHRNYGSNIDRYDEWHAYFRANLPPTLVVWGEHDFVFAKEGASAYLQDLPKAEIHMIDAGHFALESRGREIAMHIRKFFRRG